MGCFTAPQMAASPDTAGMTPPCTKFSMVKRASDVQASSSLRALSVRACSACRRRSRKWRDSSSPRTLNGYRSVYSSFFGWLTREGLIDRNPMNNLTTIKMPKVKKQPLSAVDAAKVAEVAGTVRDRALIAFLTATGCRVGEVVGANREDIDWETKSLIVCGKGEKERRVLLDDVTAMRLKTYLDSRTDSCPALFAGRGGVRLGIGGIEKVLRKAGKAAGVEKVHPHRYRRTFASDLIKKGMPIQEVQLLLGHEKIETTMTYVTVDERDVAERYRRLA